MKTVIERFADFAFQTAYEDIPGSVIQKVKLQILTYLTAAKFSDWHEGAKKVFQAADMKRLAPANSTVIALDNKKLCAEEAAVVNSAYAMTLDFDGYMLMGHMGHSSVFTPLAFLEENDGSLRDLLVATTVCNELMGRLTFSCFLGPLNGQTWSYVHNLGAAVAVAKILKLSRDEMANAMSIALYQPNFCLSPGFWNEDTKLLTASIPLRAGIQAALYAQAGLSGPSEIIEGNLGFMHFFSFHPVKELTGDLGKAWLSETLSYKRYPGTSYIGAPVDAVLGALRHLNFEKVENIGEIKKIEINATLLSYMLEKVSGLYEYNALDAIKINFSVRYSTAYALLRGDLLPQHFKEYEISKYATAIVELAAKIEVNHDWALSARTMRAFPHVMSVLKNLRSFERDQLKNHMRAMSGKSPTNVTEILSGVWQLLASRDGRALIRSYFPGKPGQMSLTDINLADFPMLQSANARITLKNGESGHADFPIPTGGAGTDFNQRKKWVGRRCEMAFQKEAKNIFQFMEEPTSSVRGLMKMLSK